MDTFPPRSSLPRTITVAKVTLLGDTWYERGARYWWRRVLMVVCGAPILAVLTVAFVAILSEIHQSSVPGFWIFIGLQIAYTLVIFISQFRTMARRWHQPYPPERTPKRRRSLVGRILRPFVWLVQVVLGLGIGLCIGLYVLMFVLMLMPETSWERPARLRMAERIRALPPDTASHPLPARKPRGTAKRLAEGPTLLVGPDQTEKLTALLAGYAPGGRRRGHRMIMGNGVLLHGPVTVSAQTAADAGLPPGLPVGYYAGGAADSRRQRRLAVVKALNGECLVRGLAARLPATRYSIRPWAELGLGVYVYAAQPVPVEQVIAALRTFAGDELVAHPHEEVTDAYLLYGEGEPRFFVSFWPSRLANSIIDPPPAALGSLRDHRPCRWELRMPHINVASADAESRALLGNAALALAHAVDGAVTDTFGFPVAAAEDVVAG
ncbi:MAG TPA: hypothetical protein VGG05_26755 [Pseudonocardiaceae bacterium]|jgi:uncharacterized membrane protein YhaH (DUF805 family)